MMGSVSSQEKEKTKPRERKSPLTTIREINKLIIRDVNLEPLFRKSLDILSTNRRYANMAIGLKNEERWMPLFLDPEDHQRGKWRVNIQGAGDAPECIKVSVESRTQELISSRREYCEGCGFCHWEENYLTLIVPVSYKSSLGGVILVSFKTKKERIREEIKLLKEVGRSIAFAQEKLKREKNLRQHEEKFKELFEAIPDTAFVIDKEKVIKNVNKAAVELTGYPKKELVGTTLENTPFFPTKTRETLEKKFRQRLQGKHIIPYTVPLERKDGEIRYVEVNANPLKQKKTNIGSIGILRDVTRWRQAKKEIKESREKYRTIFESANDAILIMEGDYFVNCNQKALEMFECSQEDLIGHVPYEFSPPKQPDGRESKEKALEKINAAFSGKPQFFEWVHTTANGTPFYAEVSLNCMDLGKKEYVLAIVRDCTERRKAKKKIEILHAWARKLTRAENMDEISKYTLDAMQKTLGFQTAGVLLRENGVLKSVTERGFERLKEEKSFPIDGKGPTVEAFNTGKSILVKNVENHFPSHNLSQETRSVLAVPIKLEKEVIGVLNAESDQKDGFDKRDKRLMEILASHVAVAIKELQEKKRRISLQQLDQLRNRFLAMAAHEINTPLTPIKTGLEMLYKGYEGSLTKKQTKRVGRILESVDRLIRLVEDFRRISKLHTGRISLKKREHALAKSIKKVLKKYEDIINRKEIQLHKRLEKPLIAKFDEDRIIQVLQNLIENAIDYTKDTIWIRGREEGNQVFVTVKDNGVGVPEEKQDKIFEPFYRVEEERGRGDRKFGGTGLGLHICKQIISAHDGNIQIHSKPGKGTTFTVLLPKT